MAKSSDPLSPNWPVGCATRRTNGCRPPLAFSRPCALLFAWQRDSALRREETNAVIVGLARDGMTIKDIVRRTGYSRGLARKIPRGQRYDIFRIRQSSLEVHLPWLDAGGRAPQRRGVMATAQATGLSRMPSGGRGMGRAAATGRQGRRRRTQPRSFGPNHRPPDDDRPRWAFEIRDGYRRGDRARCALACTSARNHRSFPSYGQKEIARRP